LGEATRSHWKLVWDMLEQRQFCTQRVPKDNWNRTSRDWWLIEGYCLDRYKAVLVVERALWHDLGFYLSVLGGLSPFEPPDHPLRALTPEDLANQQREWWKPALFEEFKHQYCTRPKSWRNAGSQL
jgi:hypothetical protein